MKLLKTILPILSLILILPLTESCSKKEEKIKDDKLSSFMLGGIYFVNGYGGIDNVLKMVESEGLTSNRDIVDLYKEILEFPFKTNQGSSIKSMLKEMWDITNKETLLTTLEDLKTREFKHKSWDYARIVNNACMGYAAGYLTKDEVNDIIIKLLPLAQEKYKTWDEYYTDFNLGRIDWNPEDKQGTAFEYLSKNMTKGEQSIYKILPLNP